MTGAMVNAEKPVKGTRARLIAIGKFFLCMLTAYLLTKLLKVPEFTVSQLYVLFILFFSMGLWVTEVIPPFATGLLIIAFLVFSMGNPAFNPEPQEIARYANTFSSSIIWLMLGGFFLASAMSKTKLDESLLSFTIRISGNRPRNLVIGLMTVTMLASMLMSNTACTAMIIGAIMPLLNSLGKESGLGKAILLGVPVAAATGGMATIIGTAPNIIAAGALENSGIDITFSQWMLFGTPITLALTAVCCTVLLFRYVKSDEPVSLEFLKSTTVNRTHEMIIQRNIVIVILLVTVFMWLTSEWHGVSVAGVSAIPIVFLTLTGIVTGKDVRAIPWDTLFLVAGGMSLGVALQFNGILKYYAGTLVGLDLNQHLMLMILAFMTMTFANLMSHTATATVLVPLGIAVLPGAEIAAAVIIGLAASTAMLLPVSTPPNAIAFSTGLLRLKDFRLCGTLVGILGPLLIVLWILSCT